MDSTTVASSLVYLVTGVLTTVAHQILVYQGVGSPNTLLVPFFNYCGMALVELVPSACGGLESAADASAARKAKQGASAERTVVGDLGAAPSGRPARADSASRAARRGAVSGSERASPTLADDANDTASAASAAGAPEPRSDAPTGPRDNEVVLCPTGGRIGPCMPRSIAAALSRPVSTWTVIAASVALDLCGFTAGNAGLSLAGSGVFQVVHASVVVFAALFAWLLRGRSISSRQWIAIALITAGLVISATGSGGTAHAPPPEAAAAVAAPDAAVPAEAPEADAGTADAASGGVVEADMGATAAADDAAAAAGIGAGIVFTLLGSVLYGLNYSLLDALSSAPTAPPQGRLASSIGSWAAAAVALWVAGYTLPRWGELIEEPAARAGGDQSIMVTGFVLIAVSALAHSLAYFRLLRGHGAVVIGVLQALRAAAVFLVGSALFCGFQESQCLTVPRGGAVILVSIGVVIFASAKVKTETAPTPAD